MTNATGNNVFDAQQTYDSILYVFWTSILDSHDWNILKHNCFSPTTFGTCVTHLQNTCKTYCKKSQRCCSDFYKGKIFKRVWLFCSKAFILLTLHSHSLTTKFGIKVLFSEFIAFHSKTFCAFSWPFFVCTLVRFCACAFLSSSYAISFGEFSFTQFIWRSLSNTPTFYSLTCTLHLYLY